MKCIDASFIVRLLTSHDVDSFYGDAHLHQEALKMANLYNISATYDAHYLALAERLQVELWTADRRLFNSVSKSLSWVKLI